MSSLFSEEGLFILTRLTSYFVPFIAVASAGLVLFSALDRKLCLRRHFLMSINKSLEQKKELLNITRCLEIIRDYKIFIIHASFVLFAFVSLMAIVAVVIDSFNTVPNVMRGYGLLAGIFNWVFIAITLTLMMMSYELIHHKLHKPTYSSI